MKFDQLSISEKMPVQQYSTKTYIEKYKRQSKSHAKPFLTAFKKILGTFKGKKILDIGCGDGIITTALAKKSAKVVGTDPSGKMIEECVTKYGNVKNLKFFKGKAQNIRNLQAHKFDAVIINMVLLNVESKKEVNSLIATAAKSLNKKGVLIFSDLHLARVYAPKTRQRGFTFEKGFDYFKEGGQFATQVHPDKETLLKFVDVHWPLETYTTILQNNGFCVTHIIETKHPERKEAGKHNLPVFIVFGCKKIN